MTEREKTLDRVRKLLRLAHGAGSQEESESAMLRAQRIMAANGLADGEVGDLRETFREEIVDEPEGDYTMKRSHSPGSLSVVIASNFRCRAYLQKVAVYRKPRAILRFLGRKNDVAIAVEIYREATFVMENELAKYLVGARDRVMADVPPSQRWAKSAMLNPTKETFRAGFIIGLREKFSAQVRSANLSMAVIPDEEVQRKVQDLGLSTVQRYGQMGEDDAMSEGKRAGKEFEMKKRVEGSSARNLLPGKKS